MATKKVTVKKFPKVVKPVVKKTTVVDKLKNEIKELKAQAESFTRTTTAQRTADTTTIERLRKERNEARDAIYKKDQSVNDADYKRRTAEQLAAAKDAQITNLNAQIAILNQQVAQFKAVAETNGAVLGRLLPGSVAAEMTKANGTGLGYPMFMPESSKSVSK